MGKILKTERALLGVSSLTLVSPATPPTIAEASEADQLRATLDEHKAEILRLGLEIERARKQAYEAGHLEGHAKGQQDADRISEVLRNGVTAQQTAIAAQLQELEPLALAIAANALERVIGPLANQTELVTQIVKKQVAALRTEAQLEIELAQVDFPSAAVLEALKSSFKGQCVEFRLNTAMKSGECRIQLRLGALDVGPTQQWAALTGGLSRMAGLGAK